MRDLSAAHASVRSRVRSTAVIAVLAMVLAAVGAVQLVSSEFATAAGPWRMDATTLHVTGWNAAQGVAGDPVASFRYMINVDNTGTTDQRSWTDGCSPADPGYPASCSWTSMGVASGAPVYAQGDASDFTAGIDIAPGRYLISVMADGYKLDGAHFAVLDDGSLADPSGSVEVHLQPQPLPDATIQAAVFEDISPVNSAPDLPAEHGLAGFTGQVRDTLGQVTTDVYGAPLCGNGICLSYCYVVDAGNDLGYTPSDADGRCPTIPDQLAPGDPTGLLYLPKSDAVPFPTLAQIAAGATTPVPASAAIEGKIEVPNLGTNRFTISVTPPDGTNFVQTTTLEGNHDWDSWIMEGTTGLDTEFAIAGEPFPGIIFGYAPASPTAGDFARDVYGVDGESTGSVTGVVDEVKVYVPAVGGVPNGGQIWGGLTGGKISKPIPNAWVSLTDLTNGDTAVWVGQTNQYGAFTIPHVPDGTYTMTWWDEPQDYILDLQNITVENGEALDAGVLPLTGWWTQYDGYVFNDTNRNGSMDWTDTNGNGCPDAGEGELGVPNYTLTLRRRENTLMDRGTTTVGTDACGHYFMESAYPMTQWLVMEAYNDLYYTTGVSYQADNQNEPTTVVGAGVDVSVLPIIGLSGRMDWGVHAYDARGRTNGLDPRNGGIVGTVSYDTTRNELDPRYAAVEDWQPGVSGLTVDLYAPVQCSDPQTESCDAAGMYQLDADGSYLRGTLLNTYVTESWQQPGKNDDGICTPRDADGNELVYPTDQQITSNPSDCLEAPLMGVQFQHGFSTVDGNYGFADGCFNGTLDATDPANPTCTDGNGQDAFEPLPASDYLVHVNNVQDSLGRPVYSFTREEDINIANGDEFVPQQPPPACAGALHTVDVAGIAPDGPDATVNPTFADIGGSPYEGQARPLCNTKLVPLANGRSIVPTFNVFTQVPLPGRFWGLVVDDLNFSSDPHQINFGEKAGVPFAPVGIYDYTNRLVYTTESDYSGLFDVLMPSTNRINCPTPSGVCANVYRFVGNDPGGVGQLNANYHPEFRTIAADFEALPGVLIPADLAPTQVGVTVQLPGGQANLVQCAVAASTPELFSVNTPYVRNSGSVTIEGQHFGADPGSVTLTTASGVITELAVTAWSDATITATVDAGVPAGPQQLAVTAANGDTTANGLTLHVLRASNLSSFPATDVLDDFNLGASASLSNQWVMPLGGFSVRGNQMSVRGLTAFGLTVPVSVFYDAQFGPDQEAYMTVARSINNKETGVVLKRTPSLGVRIVRTNNSVQVRTTKNGLTWTTARTYNTTITNGQVLGARAFRNGAVEVYRRSGTTTTLLGTVNLVTGAGSQNWGSTNRWSAAQAATSGQIGVYALAAQVSSADNTNDPRLDDFGGGTLAAGSYSPNVVEVGPGRAYTTVQAGVDAAEHGTGDQLVVVYPGTPEVRTNPRGAYYENLIVTKPIKLQGVGPGGVRGNETVPGSIIDGSAFAGDGQAATDWYTRIDALAWDGNQTVNDGAVVSYYTTRGAFAPTNPQNADSYTEPTFKAAIDGFDLRGGDQQGFPGNLNVIGGGATGLPANVQTQGGAIFANAYARYLQITNNVVQNNGGGYGTVRIGTPDLTAGENRNEHVRIAHNRIVSNGGTNLAGGIGLFAESDGYVVADNDICGNFSAEYGGALTAMGYSPGGTIDHNRIWFNRSYDEGGALMIAGELPADPTVLSQGSGAVTISRNLIQANLSNDDGGGLRFLMAGNYPMEVWGNTIVNNVSTHEGGGVAIDDAPDVRFHDNTVMKNLTTATALTSDGSPAPAGLSTTRNSQPMQDRLIATNSPLRNFQYSRPTLFNNVFWDNRAGTRGGAMVLGIGATGDSSTIDEWDLGVTDVAGSLAPTTSIVQQDAGLHPYTTSPSNSATDPGVVAPYDTQVAFNAWRTNPNFIGAIMVSLDLPPELLGDYHLAAATSSAVDRGAASATSPANAIISAATIDIDSDDRPSGGGFDIGADEFVTAPGRFPSSPALDTFNRTASTNLGTKWSRPTTGWSTNGSQLQARAGTTTVLNSSTKAITRTTVYGANQEAYVSILSPTSVQVLQGVVLKATSTGSSMILAVVDPHAQTVSLWTKAPGQGMVQRYSGGFSMNPVNGAAPQLGVRATYDGVVTIYRSGTRIWSQDLDGLAVKPWSTALSRSGGLVGVIAAGTTATRVATFDNFGGGNQR